MPAMLHEIEAEAHPDGPSSGYDSDKQQSVESSFTLPKMSSIDSIEGANDYDGFLCNSEFGRESTKIQNDEVTTNE